MLEQGLRRKFRVWAGRLALVLASVLLSLLVAELALRLLSGKDSTFESARQLDWFQQHGQSMADKFELHPEFGFQPQLGTGLYDRFGCLENDYPLEKSPQRRRLLFIGDSVTYRGRIVEALRRRYGEEDFEYWNAGVESFNTIQEIEFYYRYNAPIQPDHVILTFLLNDFEATPVCFLNKEGHLVVYSPYMPLRRINPWLFQYSMLYRFAIGRSMNRIQGFIEISLELRDALDRFARHLEERGIRFTVLVHPYLDAPEEGAMPSVLRKTILNILEDLKIRHFDLTPVVERALAEGLNVREQENDNVHPNQALAERFGAYLVRQGLLGPVENGGDTASQPQSPQQERGEVDHEGGVAYHHGNDGA